MGIMRIVQGQPPPREKLLASSVSDEVSSLCLKNSYNPYDQLKKKNKKINSKKSKSPATKAAIQKRLLSCHVPSIWSQHHKKKVFLKIYKQPD